jgi:hypothetical protein
VDVYFNHAVNDVHRLQNPVVSLNCRGELG